MLIRVHFSRPGAPRGLPWTLHTSRGCLGAAHVRFEVPVETEERPERPSNPRYFVTARGTIRWEGRTAVVVGGQSR